MGDFDAQPGRTVPHAPDVGPRPDEVAEHDVADALAGLARLVSDVDTVEDVLAQIAQLAVVAVPGADGAGVTLVALDAGPSSVLIWSVTAPFMRELDRLQYDVCEEGPCLTAIETARPLISGSLGSDARWPRFGGRAARRSVHSAMALPLVVRGVVVGSMNLYAYARDAFDERAVALGELFAVPAAVSLHNTRRLHATRDHAANLEVALTSRSVIDQAIGIVRSRSGGNKDEAFDRLRQLSQAEHVKLAVVAERVVEEAVRRARRRQ